MHGLAPGKRRSRIRIERPVADDSFDGAGSGAWPLVAEVWAEVQDMLPSRGEKIADGLNIATRPARVRIRHRRDITSDMRVQIGRNVRNAEGVLVWQTDRTAQIITPPITVGDRDGLEFMIEDYSTAGNAA